MISSLVGGFMGSNAANSAANVESQGAQKAQGVISQGENNALDFQNNVWSGTQAAEQPYQQVGSTAANKLNQFLGTSFTAPTLQQAEQTPGYQFTLQQGTNAIDENAAATGNLMSGTTGTALENYGEGLASTTYQQDFQNALNTYMTNYGALSGAAGLGLSSTGQLGQFGQSAAYNTGNIDLSGSQMQAQQINNAAAARAQGILGSSAAWSNAIGGMTGGASNMLQDLPGVPDWASAIAMA